MRMDMQETTITVVVYMAALGFITLVIGAVCAGFWLINHLAWVNP